ncbi:MAG: ABC transporter ATP-binding protein [Pseudomonadota bacterium]
MSLLTLAGLTIQYGDDVVVDDVSFEIAPGESLGLVGESGSGKTQTALSILGLLPAAATVAGSIQLHDQELMGASEAQLNAVRGGKIAMVFQDPAQALNPYRTLGAQFRHIVETHVQVFGAEADERIVAMFERVGLPRPAQQLHAYPHELSGGMRQRAMIAAALITKPAMLIADEPTTALDVTIQAQILDLLDTVREDTALLFISHDLGVVASCCERTLVMADGRVVELGPTRTVFTSPQRDETRALIAASPRLDATVSLPAPDDEILLSIEDVSVRYAQHSGEPVIAVENGQATLRRGETVAIVGESGSGKTSLARAILGLVPLHSGRIVFCGDELDRRMQARDLSTRRDLQLVFQDPAGSLNPHHHVAQLIGEPLHVHEPNLSADRQQQRIHNVLLDVGLDDSFLDRRPHQLSGGQAQRVAIARALVLAPQVLICDEAVAALDNTVQQQILELLRDVQAKTGLSIVFISHDLAVVCAISHRVVVMQNGQQVEAGDTATVFTAPTHPYTEALLAAVPTLNV